MERKPNGIEKNAIIDNNNIEYYKKFISNLKKESQIIEDKLKKIFILKTQLKDISNDIEFFKRQGKEKDYFFQKKSLEELENILNNIENNSKNKKNANDKIYKKFNSKINSIVTTEEEKNLIKTEIIKNSKEKELVEKTINKLKEDDIPFLEDELIKNQQEYSNILTEYKNSNDKINKINNKINNQMYNDIIKLSQNISKLETERNELLKLEKKAEEIQKKKEIIDGLNKELTKMKKEKKNADLEIVKCEDMINDIMIHINLNYINMTNLKSQIQSIEKNQNNIQKYYQEKDSNFKIIEKQIDNIICNNNI